MALTHLETLDMDGYVATIKRTSRKGSVGFRLSSGKVVILAPKDIEIHNKFIREGDKVLYWFASGNRDPNTFENPFEVDLYRKPNKHQSFGQGGPHICLGIWLARLEVRCLFQELSKRIKSIQQIAPHKYLRSNFVSGIKELPINITLS